MESKKLFEEVFSEVDVNDVDDVLGGKWSKEQCVADSLACAASAEGCGSVDATLCDAIKKNCY